MSIFNGDCKDILRDVATESIDMIYLDPPFFTQKTHKQKTRKNATKYSFNDSWDSIEQYIAFMKERLIECHRVLKMSGNIFLHCDRNASHYLRIILDDVFGSANFRNEIIWAYKRWTNMKSALQSQHQNIYFYGKSNSSKFNTLYTDYSPSTNVDQILQEREKDSYGKSVYKTNEKGEVIWCKDKKGVALGDVWEIPYLNPKANERIGYPTQKPVLLLERIIEISTEENDIVLDPFCGSGTTLVAANLLGRRYIGIDISEDACDISRNRIEHPIKTVSEIVNKGAESYLNKTQLESSILASLEAIPVQRNSGIDGFVRLHRGGQVIPLKIQTRNETLQEAEDKLVRAAWKRKCKYMILIRTHDNYNQLTLNQPNRDGTLFIIDSLELSVANWFSGIESFARKVCT